MSVDSGGCGAAGSGFGAGWWITWLAGGRRRGPEAGRAVGRSGVLQPLPSQFEILRRPFWVWLDVSPMEQPQEGEQQPWGRLLRLGADEGEPHVLLRKREWTIGRRRGAEREQGDTGTRQGNEGRGAEGGAETGKTGIYRPWEAPGRGTLCYPVFPLEWTSCMSCQLSTYQFAPSFMQMIPHHDFIKWYINVSPRIQPSQYHYYTEHLF